MESSPVYAHAKKTFDAIVCLRDAGYHIPALMLTYAAIDQMSWLAIPENRSSGNDFKVWVQKYMLSNGNLVCSADDLWAARNGLLHMGIAESNDHTRGVAKNYIYYTVGNAVITRNSSQDVIFLNLEKLIMAYITGILWFMEDLQKDITQLSIALAKIRKTLTVHGT